MRVDLHFTPNNTDELSLRETTVVVIDVLRASSTIAAALYNGAKEIIPVASIERAVKISGNLFGEYVLRGGERHGKMIEGFNLGNSPAEYTEEKVKGKSIIFSTTNGSFAIDKARFAGELLVCAFVNVGTVTAFLKENRRDLTIICAGTNGMFSIEDAVCAGMLVHRLSSDKTLTLDLSDGALGALTLHKAFGKGILKMIKNSEHGKYLAEIGYEEDLDLCAGIDTIPVLPQMVGNVIKWKRDAEKKEAAKVRVSS
jgi:2-phosphosulfolactate phosphatase